MICSSVNLLFFTSYSFSKSTLPQNGGVSGEHVTGQLGPIVADHHARQPATLSDGTRQIRRSDTGNSRSN
jgi:hypothetical protein